MKKHLSDKNLSSYVDGDLKPKQKERIEEHLAGCKACSRRLEEFKGIKATAADFKQVEVPDGMLVGIRARLANEGQRLGSAIPAKSRRQFGFWHGIAVGFSLTSAVLIFIILPHIGRLDTDQK
ncbi:hypothetical protein GF359_04545, partial [candidate division WOR-3 bacterium]|nr:hypothetical protein [candidate division WOR-3 bacterium]MBD3364464.1 hypothetical protein [candidate division WOR-3 bacterium]